MCQCSTMVDEMRLAALLMADGVDAMWLSLGMLAVHDNDDPSSHSVDAFPTPTDDTELWDSVSAVPDGLVPTANGSSGLDEDDERGIGLNISVVESAANGTLLTAVALSASSALSSFSPSATKRMQRFFRLLAPNHSDKSTEHITSQVNSHVKCIVCVSQFLHPDSRQEKTPEITAEMATKGVCSSAGQLNAQLSSVMSTLAC